VEFYYKNKFEKLVHFVGFIIRIITARISRTVTETNPSSHKADYINICGFLLVEIGSNCKALKPFFVLAK